MDFKYFFVVMWGEINSGSGEAVSSFQCGSLEDLSRVGGDPGADWEGYEGGAEEEGGVQIWDRGNDELTCILGRGNDLEAVSGKFFSTVGKNFAAMLRH